MTFLQPALLLALPLAALPVLIHLIHLYRRRQVKWAAMMFLQAAQRMSKGLSRLRQILILTLRVLMLAALIFMATRPLSGGWLGFTGGAPETVLILVDRSASMEQKNTVSGISKREAGLKNISKAITEAVGTRSHLVLIDSALGKPVDLSKASELLTLPQTEPTDTEADIPGLLQDALDYISTNHTGRTDIWILSDLQQGDWEASSGRWQSLRVAFAALPGVRFHILTYPEPAPDDLGVSIDNVSRRETADKAELIFDFKITSVTLDPVGERLVPIQLDFVINGTTTTATMQLKDHQLVVQGYSVPIDKSVKRGWGCLKLPADSFPANDVCYFDFDEPPVLKSVVVSDDDAQSEPLKAALDSGSDPDRTYTASILSSTRAAEVPWDDVALIVWNAPLPKAEDPVAKQLQNYVAAGRSILFLPPESPNDVRLFGLGWDAWEEAPQAKPFNINWWRNDDDLLANTRDGAALPVGSLEISRLCGIVGDGVPLARVAGHGPLLMRSLEQNSNVYFLGTLPGPGSSSLARDGVVMYALLQRALNEAVASLGKAQERPCAAGALGPNPETWHALSSDADAAVGESKSLRSGVFASGDRIVALNRPAAEDQQKVITTQELDDLFTGLDFRVLSDSLENGKSLTSEIWRTFLLFMALALLSEALLCLPPKRAVNPVPMRGSVTPIAKIESRNGVPV